MPSNLSQKLIDTIQKGKQSLDDMIQAFNDLKIFLSSQIDEENKKLDDRKNSLLAAKSTINNEQ